ncbi:MAG: DUF5615 family PIN-like protein [Proteobacteria bacterium]|jgi:predicted nuclease of predicted toxin-antitoxin system|nr:DUF5615 family PIN-like protein [Pseudomonadota bacterium]
MKITFLLDENIPFALLDLLEERGYNATHLKKIGKQGIKNGDVYHISEDQRMWIVTRDADFQNLRNFYTYKIPGIILFKMTRSKTQYLLEAMNKLLDKHHDKLGRKHLIIIEDHEMRIFEGE